VTREPGVLFPRFGKELAALHVPLRRDVDRDDVDLVGGVADDSRNRLGKVGDDLRLLFVGAALADAAQDESHEKRPLFYSTQAPARAQPAEGEGADRNQQGYPHQ